MITQHTLSKNPQAETVKASQNYTANQPYSAVATVRKAGFIVLLILLVILIPMLGIFAKLHYETRQYFAQTQAQLEIAAEYKLPTHNDFKNKLDEKQGAISPLTGFSEIYKLQADAQLLTEEIENATINHQRTVYQDNLEIFKTTLSNTETLPIPSYIIMKNVYLDASSKPLEKMRLSEVDAQINSLTGYQKQLEKELDDAKVNLLYAGLQESKNEVEIIRDFLTKRGDFAEENVKLNEYVAKIDSMVAVQKESSLDAKRLEEKIAAEVTPILQLPKATKQRIEEEEIARIQELSKTETGRRELAGLPAAPAVPADANKVIFISIARQELYLYEKGQLIKSGFTVTGKPGFETVRGNFAIYAKQRNAVLRSPFEDIEYEVPVAYWMPFYSGYGLHDATWRPLSTFGGSTYTWNGSHGCANLPLDMASFIWNWAPIGTPVIVQ